MYAVIFRAEIAELDAEYSALAARMRDLALSQYGCDEFVSCTEGNQEIAISYWKTRDQIRDWKQNAEHLVAQELGRSKWYRSYTVEVVEIVRAYASCVVLLSALALGACSNQQVYTAIQQSQQLECQKLPGTQYEECMKQLSEPYDKYKRDRDELVKDK